MPRFHCPGPLTIGAVQALPPAAAHHVQVLRLASGAMLTLFDGTGGEYGATIADLGRKSATVRIDTFSPREAELPYAITLAQALPEAAKMDWIVEKAVELGAAGVQPLSAQRCVVRLSGERADKRCQHWQAIAVSAAEQCGRNRIMPVAPIAEFGRFFATAPTRLHARTIILAPGAAQDLSDWARAAGPQAVCLVIGPEGGFTPAEIALAINHGALALGLGPRVLRTETAGLAALATLAALWGEPGKPAELSGFSMG